MAAHRRRRASKTDPRQRITPRRDDLSAIDKPAHPAEIGSDEGMRSIRHDADTQGAAPNEKRPNPEGERPGPTPGNALSPQR